MAPAGQIWAQTPQPLQSSLMAALSSTISIAGQPNLTQVPQTVQASRSTAYEPRFTPALRAVMTQGCFAMTTFTPFCAFAAFITSMVEGRS
jgi:hypothetical protein